MKNYKIAVAGTGYVGLSLGVLLSQHHQVVAVDIVQAKVDMINNKKSPIQDDYIEKYLAEKDLNLTATLDAKTAYSDADFVVIAAPTNYDSKTQHFDTSAVEAVIKLVMEYGSNKKVPYSTDDKVDNPVSLYAATKKSNELMAHAYSKLYNIPSTGLRFFTVYGPAGRPDMAYFGFTNKLLKGETIQIFNYGNCKRDFTYVDDIVEGVVRVMQGAPERKNGEDGLPVPPYAVYNIGNQNPENLLDFVQILQEELIRAGVLPEDYDFDAHKKLVPMQPGDVPVTYADTSALERDFGYKPSTSLREGLRKFAEWYAKFYKYLIPCFDKGTGRERRHPHAERSLPQLCRKSGLGDRQGIFRKRRFRLQKICQRA